MALDAAEVFIGVFTGLLLFLANIGQGVLYGTGFVLAVGVVGRWVMPELQPEPPPKKKTWKVDFTAPDGYPMRQYTLEEKDANHVMRLVHLEQDRNR